MKYIVCEKPGEFILKEKDAPVRKENEALLQINKVGICGTDLHAYGGNQAFFTYPRILGHELASVVLDIGENEQGIKAGDKVIMWYVSGNRDEEAIENADTFLIDRPKARHHVSFGFGIHRCMGNRLAEMQLRIVWEEIMKRFRKVEIVGDIERTHSSFVKGYTHMPVRVHEW